MAVKYWRDSHDDNFAHEMDRRMNVTLESRQPFVREMTRWYGQDIKEHRRSKFSTPKLDLVILFRFVAFYIK